MTYVMAFSFVFQPYTWHIRAEPSVEYNGHLIPSRIPLSALISGDFQQAHQVRILLC